MIIRTIHIIAVGVALAGVSPAIAHPHIVVDAKVTIGFDDAGRLSSIRHAWTFDEAFSVWQVQGLDANGNGVTETAELQPLADENLQGLAAVGYYTSAGEAGQNLRFVPLNDAQFTHDLNRSTLTFTVAPQPLYRIEKTLHLSVADPSYYLAIRVADSADVTLANAPPGCGSTLEPPKVMDDALANELAALGPDVFEIPQGLADRLRGVQGAIVITCDR